MMVCYFFFFQAEDGIRDLTVTGVQTCALPISIGGDRVEDRVVGRVDEDLAHLAALAHAADECDQRHPLEAMLAEQPQAPRDDRCAAVGGEIGRASCRERV